MPSFTTQLPDLQRDGPLVEVDIAVGSHAEAAMQDAGQDVPAPVGVHGLIDTGASSSVVREGIPGALDLHPVGVTRINTPSSTDVPCSEYLVRFVFPNDVIFETTAIEAPLQGQRIECLIGRDVLARAVLIYNGYTELFTLSF